MESVQPNEIYGKPILLDGYSEKEKLNYFDTNYKDISGINFAISNENNKLISKTLGLNEQNNEKCENDIKTSLHDDNETTSVEDEKTLAEIGFNSNDIENWDEINQPEKTNLLELIDDMIKNFKKTDIAIVIGKNTFHCHMIVLQCYSDFIMNTNTENTNTLELPEDHVTSEAFAMIYGWMLSEHPKVKHHLILELFNAANFLKIKGILNQCWACIDDTASFREDTAFLLYLEANKYKQDLMEQIQQLMLTRICKFFLTLVASKEFLEMTPKEICTLFNSNTIGVYSETEVLMAAVRWLQYDFTNRQKHIESVMKCIRFGLIAPWQLVELKRSTTCREVREIVENSKVQNMIDDGLSYVTTKHYYRNCEAELLDGLKRLNLYKPVERQWICDKTWMDHKHCLNKQIITYEKFLQYLQYVRIQGKDYWKKLVFIENVPDFYSQDDVDDDINVLILKDKSTQKTPRNYPIKNCNSFRDLAIIKQSKKGPEILNISSSMQKQNYVTNNHRHISTNHNFRRKLKYQIIKSPWKIIEIPNNVDKLNGKRNGEDISKKCMLLFGGLNPYKNIEINSEQIASSRAVLSYNFQSNKWKEFARMPGSRHHHKAVVCNQKIYIIGGTKPSAQGKQIPVISDSVWSFDPHTIKWSTETRLPYPRRDFGLIAIENGFYVIGGEGIGNTVLSSTLFYDIKTKIWEKRASLSQSRSGLMVIANTTTITTSNIEEATTTTTLATTVKTTKKWKKFWAAGGILDIVNFIITDQIEEYNVNEDIWHIIGYLRIPRCFGKLCIINNIELYCVGGITNIDGICLTLKDVDKYYQETNEWKCVTKMPTNRHGHDLITINEKIIILGGVSIQEENVYESIECYSTTELKWINDITSLPSPLSSTSCVLYDI